jgi:hypothetical protein
MKKILLLLLLISVTHMVKAQLPWKVKLGSKYVLQTTEEDEEKNILVIKNSKIGTKNNLTLSYKIPADEKEWVRTVMFDDMNGSTIAENSSLSVAKKGTSTISYFIANKQLSLLLNKYKKITVYVTSIPSDPEKAAMVRVRKVHVCTISLQ